MEILIGLPAGIALGLVQMHLFSKYTAAVTGGKLDAKTAMLGVGMMLLPFALLAVMSFIWLEALLWFCIGIAAGLITGALIKFLRAK